MSWMCPVSKCPGCVLWTSKGLKFKQKDRNVNWRPLHPSFDRAKLIQSKPLMMKATWLKPCLTLWQLMALTLLPSCLTILPAKQGAYVKWYGNTKLLTGLPCIVARRLFEPSFNIFLYEWVLPKTTSFILWTMKGSMAGFILVHFPEIRRFWKCRKLSF